MWYNIRLPQEAVWFEEERNTMISKLRLALSILCAAGIAVMASGKLRFDAKVTKSTSTTLDAVFPKIDLPVGDGSYLCVASRDGMPNTHSVRTVRRRALILPAIS